MVLVKTEGLEMGLEKAWVGGLLSVFEGCFESWQQSYFELLKHDSIIYGQD